MAPIGLRKTRLNVIVAATELLLGLCLYAYPTGFFMPEYLVVTRFTPLISSVLVGSGALLLVLDENRLPPRWYRLLAVLPAIPLAVFAAVAALGASWTALIIYGLLALALLLPSRQSDATGRSVDLWQATLGLAQVLSGLTFLFPQLYPTPPYAPFLPFMWWMGGAGILGGAVLMATADRGRRPPVEAAVRLAGAFFPAAISWGFFVGQYYTGVVLWGTMGASLLLGVGNLTARPAPAQAPSHEDAIAASVEQRLESWMWILVFAVIGLNMASHRDNPSGTLSATLFVLIISLYNALVFRGLRGVGPVKLRIHIHLSLLAITVSVLLLHATIIGHSLLALLAIIPSVGTRAKGKTEGYRLMAISGVGVLLSFMFFGRGEHTLMEAMIEVGLLEITSLVGLRLAVDERRMAGELIEQQQALRRSEERFRFAFENAPIGMALTDPRGTILQANQALCRMLGYSAEEIMILGSNGLTHPDDQQSDLPADFLAGTANRYQREKRYVHKDGHTVWGLLSLSRVGSDPKAPLYFIGHIQDISEQKSYEQQLLHLASYDPLTDLFNRRRFQEELEQHLAVAARNGGCGALLFFDLDQFKYVNDTLGHQAGDEFLRSLANILRLELRRGAEAIARLGGDEFAAILPGADEAVARAMADRVLVRLRSHVQVIAGQSVSSTASIGIALYPAHGVCAADLLARADFAMYQAKEQGRNRAYLFRPDSDAVGQAENKLRWERLIREALEADRLMLYCQPIWDLRTGRTSHHELLLRMQGEQGEVIPPGAFLPVAERFGLIHMIDRWVVRQAIHTIAAEARCGRRAVVEINLSGLAFGDADLLPLIRKELAVTGIDPGCLILEITETAAIADLDQARQFVMTLRELGCRFAIDDFGSGFASFAYLKHLPVDYLKIDGSFVENLVRDPVDQHLVKGMVEVARGLGKQTIAEFVGDLETLEMLKEFGVDFAQGYYVGRPAPRTEHSFAE